MGMVSTAPFLTDPDVLVLNYDKSAMDSSILISVSTKPKQDFDGEVLVSIDFTEMFFSVGRAFFSAINKTEWVRILGAKESFTRLSKFISSFLPHTQESHPQRLTFKVPYKPDVGRATNQSHLSFGFKDLYERLLDHGVFDFLEIIAKGNDLAEGVLFGSHPVEIAKSTSLVIEQSKRENAGDWYFTISLQSKEFDGVVSGDKYSKLKDFLNRTLEHGKYDFRGGMGDSIEDFGYYAESSYYFKISVHAKTLLESEGVKVVTENDGLYVIRVPVRIYLAVASSHGGFKFTFSESVFREFSEKDGQSFVYGINEESWVRSKEPFYLILTDRQAKVSVEEMGDIGIPKSEEEDWGELVWKREVDVIGAKELKEAISLWKKDSQLFKKFLKSFSKLEGREVGERTANFILYSPFREIVLKRGNKSKTSICLALRKLEVLSEKERSTFDNLNLLRAFVSLVTSFPEDFSNGPAYNSLIVSKTLISKIIKNNITKKKLFSVGAKSTFSFRRRSRGEDGSSEYIEVMLFSPKPKEVLLHFDNKVEAIESDINLKINFFSEDGFVNSLTIEVWDGGVVAGLGYKVYEEMT